MPVKPRDFDPLRDILSIQERMNRLFEESLLRGRELRPVAARPEWSPAVDVYETAEAFVILAELPGVAEDDVLVTVDGDEVRLRGERRLHPRPDSFERLERSYGPFARSFRFAEDVDPDRVDAEFKDGLLRLTVSKAHTPRHTGEE
jgi:HSP20 family protein